MGINLDVLIGHRLTAEQAFSLPDRLSSAWAVFAATSELRTVLEARGPHVASERWSWYRRFRQSQDLVTGPARVRDLWATEATAAMEGPCGLLDVGSKLIRWAVLEKLAAFAEDDFGIQAPIRRVSRALAHELGSARAIYLPDSGRTNRFVDLVCEGVSFDAAVARLTAQQPPEADVATLLKVGPDPNGELRITGEFAYFIDDFGAPPAPSADRS
jgi:hypothetical protein